MATYYCVDCKKCCNGECCNRTTLTAFTREELEDYDRVDRLLRDEEYREQQELEAIGGLEYLEQERLAYIKEQELERLGLEWLEQEEQLDRDKWFEQELERLEELERLDRDKLFEEELERLGGPEWIQCQLERLEEQEQEQQLEPLGEPE